MNLDERLEALTHSVELLAEMQKSNEKQVKRLGKYIRAVSQLVLDHELDCDILKATIPDSRMKQSRN